MVSKKYKKKSQNSFANKMATISNIVEVPPPILASFDKDPTKSTSSPSYLATIVQSIDQHRLKVWDIKSSSLMAEYSPKSELRYTSMTWGESLEINEIENEVSLRKKRKSVSTTTTTNHYIALGTENGIIEIYSITHGDIVKRLQGGHNGKVVDFIFSKNTKKGYSIGNDGYVVEWDIENEMEKSKWFTGSDYVTKLQLTTDEKILFVAGQSVQLFDIESQSLIKTYPGHANDIRQVVVSTSNNEFLTVADQDRFISIWELEQNKQESINKNATALTMDTMPVSISMNSNNNVLAIGEDGILYLWNDIKTSIENSDKKKKQKILTKACDSKLKIIFSEETSQILNIMFASFVNSSSTNNEVQILIGYGSMIKPKFEIISCIDPETGKFKENIELSRSLVSNLLQSEIKKDIKKQAVGVTQNKASAITSISLDEEEKEDNEQQEMSFLEKLQELDIKTKKSEEETTSKSKKIVIPKGDSIKNILQQAIHSNDKQLLETCLAVTNVRVIRNTLEMLPPQYVIPFLKLLKEKIQRRPQRARYIFNWVRYTIMLHMAYLVTVPELTSQLSDLYQLLQERSGLMGKLSQLNGRLDLINSQFVTRNQLKINQEAEVVYDEEESENNNMDEDDDEDEDDETENQSDDEEFYDDDGDFEGMDENDDIEYLEDDL